MANLAPNPISNAANAAVTQNTAVGLDQGFSAGTLSPGFKDINGNTGNPATGTVASANNPVAPATLPPLTPTTTGNSNAQTNKVNPPVVANSNAAQTDLNNINSNATTMGSAVQQQQQVQQANTNAQTQAQQQAAQQQAQTTQEAPENQPITAGDLNQALNSVNQPGQTSTDANGIQSVQPTATDNQNGLNGNINAIKDSYASGIGDLQNQENQGLQDLAKVSDAQIQAGANVQNQIQQIMNGTFPLSSGDQAQLTGLTAQYNGLIATAQGAAQAYTAGVTAAGMASGRALYTPELNLSLVSQATQSGLQKVQQLTDEGAAAYAKLQSDLQNNDLNLIQASYKATSDALTARTNAIQSTISDTKDAITQAYAQQHNDIQDAISSTQIGDTEKKNIFDEAMSNAQFTNTQKQQIQDNYFKQQGLDLQTKQVAISQEDVGIKLQALKDSENNSALAAANAAQTTGNGKTYIDGTTLDATGQAAAIKAGVPVLTATNAKSMSSVTQAQQAWSGLVQQFVNAGIASSAVDPKTGITSITFNGKTGGNSFFGSGSAIRGNINDFNKSINTTLTALQADGDSKIDGSTLGDIKSNLPKDTDSPDVIQKKMTTIQNDLTNSENGLLSNAATGTITPAGTFQQNADGSYTRIQ